MPILDTEKQIIGASTLVKVGGASDVPAKIDTGADASSIWVSTLRVTGDGTLEFILFGPGSPFYTGRIHRTRNFDVAVVRSATGQEQTRYRAYLPVSIAGHRIRTRFNLSDRSRNNFPILIGKRTLRGRFLVDVSVEAINMPKNPRTTPLREELRRDPVAFHEKHMRSASSESRSASSGSHSASSEPRSVSPRPRPSTSSRSRSSTPSRVPISSRTSTSSPKSRASVPPRASKPRPATSKPHPATPKPRPSAPKSRASNSRPANSRYQIRTPVPRGRLKSLFSKKKGAKK